MPVNAKDVGEFTLGYFKGKHASFDLKKRINELRIDSLDLVEFLMALEEKFEVEIDVDKVDQGMTFEQFCELVEKQG